MRILHVIHSYPPAIGGAGIWCKEVCKYLSQKGHKVRVLTLDGDPKTEYKQAPIIENDNIDIKVIRCKKINNSIIKAIKCLRPLKIYKTIRKIWENSPLVYFSGSHSIEMYFKMFREIKNTDIVHLHITPYIYNFLGFFIAKSYRKKIAITPHFHRGNYEHERWVNFWLMRRCDVIFAVSDYEKQYLVNKGIDKNNIFVAYNTLNLQDYHPKDLDNFKSFVFDKYNITEETKIVIFIGRKIEYKGIDTLVEAVKQLRNEMPIKLFLVGPNFPWFENYYSKLSDEEKRDIIDFGVVSHQDKVNLLHLSHVLVLPSKFEAFGIVFLEAWACGLPVIGTKGNIFASVIEDGGLAVEYGDSEALLVKIKTVLNNRILSENLSNNGLKKLQNYIWSSIGENILNAYLAVFNLISKIADSPEKSSCPAS